MRYRNQALLSPQIQRLDLASRSRWYRPACVRDTSEQIIDVHAGIDKRERSTLVITHSPTEPISRAEDFAVTPGDIFIERSALLSEFSQLESDSIENGWVRVAKHLSSLQVESAISIAGWTLFYVAGSMRASTFGFDPRRMTHTLLKRLIEMVARQKYNCLEIDHITSKSFLGVPSVSVSAHARHIQKGLELSEKAAQLGELKMPGPTRQID